MLEDRMLVGHAVHNDLKVCAAQTWCRTYLVDEDYPYRLFYSRIHAARPVIPSIMQVNRDLSTPNSQLCATWSSPSSESRSKTGSILVCVRSWFRTLKKVQYTFIVCRWQTHEQLWLATSHARSSQEEETFIRRRRWCWEGQGARPPWWGNERC